MLAYAQPDFVSVRVADALRGIADLELLQAPGLAFILPKVRGSFVSRVW